MPNVFIRSESLPALQRLPVRQFQTIYVDPPFNTRTVQKRVGKDGSVIEFDDKYDDYVGWLGPHLEVARDLLTSDGTIHVHLDHHEVHYVRVFMDKMFGRHAFLNEIIWAYDYGGRKRDRWPEKHDNILVYARTPGRHYFNRDGTDRIPYLAPERVTPEKAAAGKYPTDVWWQTIVPTNGRENLGYPTQKPMAVLRRIIGCATERDASVLDFFAGSGTTGAVAQELGRRFVLVDRNPDALKVTRSRLGESAMTYTDLDGMTSDGLFPASA